MTDTTRYDYLIIGGGMVADNAARGIRERDTEGSIGILSADVDEPYTRPALSKKLWTDSEFTWEKVPLNTAADTGATIRLETHVDSIDPGAHQVSTEAGDTVGYGKLLIATGGVPKRLPVPDDKRTVYFRSAADYRAVRALADEKAHFAAVGGGYISTELAAALVQNGCRVTLVYPDTVLGGSVFPRDVAARFEKAYADAGVVLRGGVHVTGGSVDDEGLHLELDDGTGVIADAVVAGLGIDPALFLAASADIETGDGIVVDEYLHTSVEDVFAAGDVAEYPDPILGRRRVEHVDNANEMGVAVGRIMAGDETPYTHTPYYYSKVFDISYEAVGRMDGALDTVEDWIEPLEKGVVYYLDEGEPVGVLLWNLDGKRDDARYVLANAHGLTRDDLVGRIR